MPKKTGKNLIVGLDIGTSKIVAIVGEVCVDGTIEIIGVGSHRSIGLKRGVVVNIESTVQSIRHAVAEAELMAGCEIHSAYTGIAGSHIKSFNSHGIVAIRESEVHQSDLDRVIDAAKAVAIPADQKILHILPQEYIIDEQSGIKEPIGMSGVRLETRVHMISGAVSAAQNIVKCVQACGLEVANIVLEQLASSQSVLTEDEKDLGVCLIDIGGGTTDIAIFTGGAIRHTGVIPIAGDQVTNDIAVALRTPTKSAERIKMDYACAMVSQIEPHEMITVPGMSESRQREIPRAELAMVVEARYDELFRLIASELNRFGFDDLLPGGVVLTGGGSKVKGGLALAESIFNMPVRIGVPKHVSGMPEVIANPIYATGVGLILYGHHQQKLGNNQLWQSRRGFQGLWKKMQTWFQGNF